MTQRQNNPFYEWPEMSFKEIEDIEIDDSILRLYYKLFFRLLSLPETTLKAFYKIITAEDFEKN